MRSTTRIRLALPAMIALLMLAIVAGCSSGNNGTNPPAAGPTATAANVGDAPAAPEVIVKQGQEPLPKAGPEDFAILWEAYKYLLTDYADRDKLDKEELTEAAIRGMLQAVGDPQTAYVAPAVLQGSFKDVFQGQFEGIGANVNMNAAGKVIIISPIAGSPAEAAGICAGDQILEVDGVKLEGLSLLEAVAKIRGPKGSTARLLVKHLTAAEPVEISVVRGVIPLQSVILRSQPGDPFTHIRVTDFYPNTAELLNTEITKAMSVGTNGLILDLRGNGGGLLESSIDIASMFIKDGMVMYSLDGAGTRRDYMVRKDRNIATEIPMVVLVDQGSASASEILAGALQDHKRAKVIGATTYGKGSVNWLRELSNGGGIYITVAHWYTPLGRLIQSEGIEPDLVVENGDARQADIDQLRAAMEEMEKLTGVSRTAAGAR
ncbi:MAG: S41 family peptidase [SAR202 cluster bacterium]|nr:S41 family peptidase [SAR202 cluster bacterium]